MYCEIALENATLKELKGYEGCHLTFAEAHALGFNQNALDFSKSKMSIKDHSKSTSEYDYYTFEITVVLDDEYITLYEFYTVDKFPNVYRN